MPDLKLQETCYHVVDRVATITLDRPKRANAWTGIMHTEYRALIEKRRPNWNVG